MARPTMRSAEAQEAFARDGYVVIPGFLSAAEVAALDSVYAELGPAPGDPQSYCHFDFQSPAPEYKEQVDRRMREIMGPAVERHLDRYRAFYGNFVMKWPGPESWFGVHQDMTFVDEDRYASASIWCPTVDTGESNGALHFFPGSHLMVRALRGSNQRGFAFEAVAEEIEDRCGIMVSVRAGDAIVFDHRVVHWSYANESGAPRLVAALGVIPEEAELLHYHADGEGGIEGFVVEDRFFVDNDAFGMLRDRPEGATSLGVVPLVMTEIDSAALAELVPPTGSARAVGAPVVVSASAAETGGAGPAGPAPRRAAVKRTGAEADAPSAEAVGPTAPPADPGSSEHAPPRASRAWWRALLDRVRR